MAQTEDNTIRSIKRGLDVLAAINRAHPVRLTEISRMTDLPIPTARRIVQTLVGSGMVERESPGHRYRPTALVQTLAIGYRQDQELVAVARPHIVSLTQKVGWPITVTTRVGNQMIILDSTHHLTTLTYKSYASGYALPLLECSVGKAYLAFCDEAERSTILTSLGQSLAPQDRQSKMAMSDDDSFLAKIRERGYASHAYNQFTANPGKTSSVGIPIFAEGKLAGCLGLIFFSSTMTVGQATERYLADMQETTSGIAGSWDAMIEGTKQLP